MLTPIALIFVSAMVFGAATSGMLHGAEPFATWYYPFAWFPTLLAADAALRLKTGRYLLLSQPARTLALVVWSVPFWLFFELLNFRVANWYYVFVPADAVPRWSGIVLSFATVLPAIVMAQATLEASGVAEGVRWRRLPVSRTLLAALQGAGILFFALALAWPRFFFPLIWGGVTLLVDPWVYRRDPGRSLVGALERGRPGVILRILLGGLAIGFLWELYNARARGHWIYTVPGMEEVKLFEMPVLGFLGFPVLALDGWVAWNALVLARLAPGEGTPANRRRVALAVPLALAASVGVLRGMERWTVTSATPVLSEVVGAAAPRLQAAGMSVFTLAHADPGHVAEAADTAVDVARDWVRAARLMTLRGIGAANARALEQAGVPSVEDLARVDAGALADRLRQAGVPRITDARVRVWVRAARRQAGGGS